MSGFLRQSTASQARLIGPFVDDVDFKTAKTALTIANTDIKLRANGTTLANKNSGGGTHQVNGMYSVTWDATDSANVGELYYSVVVAGALQVFGSYTVLEEAVYDALYAASAPGYVAAQVVASVTGNVGGNVTGSVGSVASGGITTASFAAGAINAAAIAADAIGASELATDAVNEIAAAVTGGAAAVEITGPGYVGDFDPGAVLDIRFTSKIGGTLTTLAGTPAISVYKDNSATQWTTTLTPTVDIDQTGHNNVSLNTSADGTFFSAGSNYTLIVTTGTVGGTTAVGNLVGAFSLHARSPLRPTTAGETININPDGTVDASGVGATPGEIADEVQTRTIAAVAVVNDKAGYALSPTSITAVWSATGRTLTSFGTLVDEVWDELTAGHVLAGSTGAAVAAGGSAGDPWITPLPGSYAAGTAGKIIGDRIAASVTGAVGSVTGNVGGNVAGSVASVTGAVGSVTVVSDKSGFRLSATGVGDLLTTALTEAYAPDGAPATLSQLLYMLWAAAAAEKVIVGTTMTVKKLDGSATAMTFTLNSATTPTAITRAT